MAPKVTRRVICLCSIGLSLVVVGAVLIPVVDLVIKHKVEQSVIIKPDGLLYPLWQDLSIPVYMQFYMWDLSNPDEFRAGKEKPYMVQRGPYTYRERRTKFNITFNDNGTVTYRQNRTFHFVREMSVGDETDNITTANVVVWALIEELKWTRPDLRKIIGMLLKSLKEDIFMTRPLKEIIWGYTDEVLHFVKEIAPDWFYTDYGGYFMNKNYTDDGVYTVFTGEKDISKLGIIDKYNGTSSLKFWSTKWANMINGTDGTLGPPFAQKSVKSAAFSSDVCRSAEGVYGQDVKSPQGINLWRYKPPDGYMANASVNPDNIGFCTPQSRCLGQGLINVSTCSLVDFFHIPAAISFPHFLLADEKYINGVGGMHPNEEEHHIEIDVEPYTGLVLQAAKRLQINIYLEPVPDINTTQNIEPVFLPIFWINESAVVDDENANKLQSMLFTPLLIVMIVEYSMIGCGVTFILWAVVYGACLHPHQDHSPVLSRKKRLPGEKSPLITNADTSVEGR